MRDCRSIVPKDDHRSKVQRQIEYGKMEKFGHDMSNYRRPPYYLTYLKEQQEKNEKTE